MDLPGNFLMWWAQFMAASFFKTSHRKPLCFQSLTSFRLPSTGLTCLARSGQPRVISPSINVKSHGQERQLALQSVFTSDIFSWLAASHRFCPHSRKGNHTMVSLSREHCQVLNIYIIYLIYKELSVRKSPVEKLAKKINV